MNLKMSHTTGKKVNAPEHLKRRLLIASRLQTEIKQVCLDDLIDEDHIARRIWEYVERLDLTKALTKIKSVVGDVGRPAIDPKILIAIWIYATIEGIGNAWTIGEYCIQHAGFIWICGNVSVDRKTISNFRMNNGDVFEELLAQGIGILTHANIVTLKEIAQDGLRVRASAGRKSFCAGKKLKEHVERAKERILLLKKEIEEDPAQQKCRIKAARANQAQRRLERLQSSMQEYERICEEKDTQRVRNKKRRLSEKEKEEVLVSRTDPEARIMKMADSGYRPAYNVQFAVDTNSQVIVGVDVSKNANDSISLMPMYEQIKTTYNKIPERYLVDAGFKNLQSFIEIESDGCKMFCSTENSKKAKNKKVDIKKHNHSCILKWVERMKTQKAKEIYKRRASTVECVNANVRNRGFYQFLVRGFRKVKSVSILMAVVHNMQRTIAFGV